MWDRKCQEIKTYIGGRKFSEAWKFIKKFEHQKRKGTLANDTN